MMSKKQRAAYDLEDKILAAIVRWPFEVFGRWKRRQRAHAGRRWS